MYQGKKEDLVNKRKPSFESRNKTKIDEPIQQKLKKIQIFYRYRIASIYRQMKIPIYETLLQEKKPKSNKFIPNKTGNKNQSNNVNQMIQILYKFVCLNSKYHHRQKMRFSRTPLLKYLECKYFIYKLSLDDFNILNQKLKTKEFSSIYDDLVQSDDQEKQQKNTKQYEKNPQFSISTINNYKKKNDISGRIVISQGYEDLKERLVKKYGWTENKDYSSLIYDFKYMSKKKDIDYVNLLDGQVINHFDQNKSITAKFGLTRNIRNIVALGKDHSDFFPRCYDINDVKQLEDFYEDFKYTYAKRVLEYFVKCEGKIEERNQAVINTVIECLEMELVGLEKKIVNILNKKAIYIGQKQLKLISSFDLKLDQTKCVKNEKLLQMALKLQKQLQSIDPQYYLNNQNIWIVKPASMSRGRGIKTFNQLNEILDYIIGKQISWVVQKYIQRPLIVRKKKFDIRQWVLLTDFKPFRVWIYDECYIRFCAQLYQPQNLKNRKIHLTNNSVTKGINSIQDGISENMMSQQQFTQQLKKIQGKDIFGSVIKPQLQKIAVQTLESVKENIVSRKNTFQLFGYDFMVDENYKAWLIEVNSSPTMEHSTETTTKIVKKGMSDLADLVENYMLKGKIYNKEEGDKLYGGWRLLTNP